MPISSVSPPTRVTPNLIVDSLVVGYGAGPVIRSVSATAGPGEVVALVGPNGAGKSTLLKALVGNLIPESGSVHLDGQNVTALSSDNLARRGVGYVPQSNDVFANMTTFENLEMGGYLLPTKRVASRVEEVVESFPKLRSLMKVRAGQLSGGERKMLGIARALMLDPRVIVFDEPSAGLAEDLAKGLLDTQVRRLADDGKTIVIVEQRALACLGVADWAYVLVTGEIHLEGFGPDVIVDARFRDIFLGGGSSHRPHDNPVADSMQVARSRGIQ
jgi:ABC-type branched-subunit amino acid transport system ATPase component